MANSYTKNYQDGSALTEAQLDTALTSFALGLDKTTNMTTGSTDGYVLTSTGSGNAAAWEAIPNPTEVGKLQNIALSATASAGALTIAVKTQAGTDPTSTDYVSIDFSDAGTTSGDLEAKTITSALSITLPASATLGVSGTSSTYVYVYALKNSTSNVALGISRLGYLDQESNAVTLVSASADSSSVIYSSVSSAQSNLHRLLGYVYVAKNSSSQWQTPTITRVYGNLLVGDSANANFIAQSRTRSTGTSVGTGGVAFTASTSYSSSSTSYVDVTDSVTITTSGRPVVLMLISTRTSSTGSSLLFGPSTSSRGRGYFKFLRNASAISIFPVDSFGNGTGSMELMLPPSSIQMVDTPAAGTYTYKLQYAADVTNPWKVSTDTIQLVAYEL